MYHKCRDLDYFITDFFRSNSEYIYLFFCTTLNIFIIDLIQYGSRAWAYSAIILINIMDATRDISCTYMGDFIKRDEIDHFR